MRLLWGIRPCSKSKPTALPEEEAGVVAPILILQENQVTNESTRETTFEVRRIMGVTEMMEAGFPKNEHLADDLIREILARTNSTTKAIRICRVQEMPARICKATLQGVGAMEPGKETEVVGVVLEEDTLLAVEIVALLVIRVLTTMGLGTLMAQMIRNLAAPLRKWL